MAQDGDTNQQSGPPKITRLSRILENIGDAFISGSLYIILSIPISVLVAWVVVSLIGRGITLPQTSPQPTVIAPTPAPALPPDDYFVDNAPNIFKEMGQYEKYSDHPLFLDLMKRVATDFKQPPNIVDVNQYRGYVLVDVGSLDGDGNYYLYVYRWDGKAWAFITKVCQNCGR